MVDDKKYKLLDGNGDEYLSDVPGTLGGNKKLKIYGRLDCPSANRWIEKGHYVVNRVFFLMKNMLFLQVIDHVLFVCQMNIKNGRVTLLNH